jgi:flagellar biosynthesis protein FlhG
MRFIPVAANPHVAFGGLMLERLCTGFAEAGARTLVVDASDRSGAPGEMAMLDFASCIEPLSSHVSYVAARGLPMRFVDATGSAQGFLRTITEAAPGCQVVLVHAGAPELCRLFGRRSGRIDAAPVFPLILADDQPASVTHAFAAMKLLTLRAGLMVHELVLGAAEHSPRANRIATQLALCADDFLGAVLRDWLRIDPASEPNDPPSMQLRRWVRERLRHGEPGGGDDGGPDPFLASAREGTRFAATQGAFN